MWTYDVLYMQMGIANRDIKLENTLLMDISEQPVLKLCDFGYSKDELCASISKTMCGELAPKGLPNTTVVSCIAACSEKARNFDHNCDPWHKQMPCSMSHMLS